MTNEERVLLELLKASLFGLPPQLPAQVDWPAVKTEAGSQTVLGIAAQAVPPESYAPWKRDERTVVINSAQKAYAEQELLALFSAQGIPLVILKGSAAAVYYPKPSRRWMGDIDFLVPQAQFAQAETLMLENGYVLRDGDKANSERDMAFYKNGIEFELHRRFSDEDLDIERWLTEGLEHAETAEIDGHRFPMLPKLANGLVLLAHMRHHLLLGMGLRQALDWMMYVDRVLDDTFWQERFCAAARESGMEKLAVTATRMCQIYLGLSEQITWCRGADEALCEALLENLLASGNFGRKQGVGNRVEKIATAMRKDGLFRYLQRAGKVNWEAYHRHRWLKPFCWLYQIFRYLRQRAAAKRSGAQVRGDLSRSRARYTLLRELEIVPEGRAAEDKEKRRGACGKKS